MSSATRKPPISSGQTERAEASAPAQVVLRAENITKSYRMGQSDLTVLSGCSLDVRRGEFIAIMGKSGSGKSRLVAEAIALGAALIGDDQILLNAKAGDLIASPHPNLAGLLELHGMGIICLPTYEAAHPIHLVVMLGRAENDRLPAERTYDYSGTKTPLLQLASLVGHFHLP